MERIYVIIEPKLISEQSVFRPGKCCTSQVLNLTEYIEKDYQEKMTTVVIVYLTAAIDTNYHHHPAC